MVYIALSGGWCVVGVGALWLWVVGLSSYIKACVGFSVGASELLGSLAIFSCVCICGSWDVRVVGLVGLLLVVG